MKRGDYKVIRALEPGLVHRYHAKECTDAAQMHACLKARAANEASKTSLGLWYLKQTYGVSVFGALAEGNEPQEAHALREAERPTAPSLREAVTKEYRPLVESLILLVLVAVVALDVFLMWHNYKHDKRK